MNIMRMYTCPYNALHSSLFFIIWYYNFSLTRMFVKNK